MPQFKVYAGEVMSMGPVAVIITTAFANAGGYPRAEYFLILPSKECTLISRSLSFDVKSFEGVDDVHLDETFMLAEAFNQATIDLGLNVSAQYEAKGLAPPLTGPNIREDNRNLLVHLWIRKHCFERLADVARLTECGELRDYLNPILALPSVTTKAL